MNRLQTLNNQMQILEGLKKDNAIGKTRYNQVKKIIENNLKKLAKEGKECFIFKMADVSLVGIVQFVNLQRK